MDRFTVSIIALILLSTSLLAIASGRNTYNPDTKTPVCHTSVDDSHFTICIDSKSIQTFLDYGDTLGPCDDDLYFKNCRTAKYDSDMCFQ